MRSHYLTLLSDYTLLNSSSFFMYIEKYTIFNFVQLKVTIIMYHAPNHILRIVLKLTKIEQLHTFGMTKPTVPCSGV